MDFMLKKELTHKQYLFIKEYLIHKNATKAAMNAGYSAKTARSAGSRLLTNVDIMAAVEKGLSEQLEKADVCADNILLELKRIAFADISDGRGFQKLKALELLGKAFKLFNNRSPRRDKQWSALDLLPPNQRR